ncbi:MAG: hypothetical protein EBU52_13550, partial [Cytophagia bacterium]|nr:hypothetical protein [Cytophagia bacterium]
MNTEKSFPLHAHKLVASIMFAFALLLMAFKIYADSEPGALPLLLLLIASAWYCITLYRLRKRTK